MTLLIIIITCIVSILALNQRQLMSRLQFHPYSVHKFNQIYRFFTYAFVHADWIHLLVNLFVLYSFGSIVEQYFKFYFGNKSEYFYAILYTGGILFSVLPAYGKHKSNPYYSAVGASGAVSGIVFSSIIFDPTSSIGILFIPFQIPSALFGILYLVYSAYMSKHSKDNIGHDAHFWGAVFGLVFTIALKPGLFLLFIEKLGALLP